ncbi:GNAT acetyltransferase-like protein [Kocuria marina]
MGALRAALENADQRSTPSPAPGQSTPRPGTHLFSGPGWHALVVEETSRSGRLWYAPYGPVLTHPSGAHVVIELLHHTAGRRGFTAHGSDSLRTAARVLSETGSCTAYTSSVGGTVVSALLPYDSPTTWVFAPFGMDFALRKLRPNQPLIVQALLDAAAQGQPVADLFGWPPRTTPPTPGRDAARSSDVSAGRPEPSPGVEPPVPSAHRVLRVPRAGVELGRAGLEQQCVLLRVHGLGRALGRLLPPDGRAEARRAVVYR